MSLNTQKLILFTIGLVVVYWITAQLHAYYCAPTGWFNIFWTPFMMGTPFCKTALQILNKTTEFYCTIWIGFISSIFSLLYNIFERLRVKEVKEVNNVDTFTSSTN
jgi:hypothetical protein